MLFLAQKGLRAGSSGEARTVAGLLGATPLCLLGFLRGPLRIKDKHAIERTHGFGVSQSARFLRTLVYQNGRASWGVGAGVVADSDPGREWDETLNKGRALWLAVQRAERGLS